MTSIPTVKPRLFAYLAFALVATFGFFSLVVKMAVVAEALTTPWVLGIYIGVAFVLAVVLSYRTKPKVAVSLRAARVLSVGAGLLVGVFMTLMAILADRTEVSVLPLVLTYAGCLAWALTSLMKLQLKLQPR